MHSGRREEARLSAAGCGSRGRRILTVLAALAALGAGVIARGGQPAPVAHPLLWDAMDKTLTPPPGEGIAHFTFTAINTSDKPVTIDEIRPTCGCTVAAMPSAPWVLAPHASGSFTGTIDFRGKEGTVMKALFVSSSAGTQRLTLTVKIPTLDDATRKQNQMTAQRNRQAVFRGQCATCHLEPARGLSGAELFTAACGVCHFAERRASMVPDLLIARQHRDAVFWRKWISEGKEGTLMPAWSRDHGGPLTRAQIESLVQFALAVLPTEPPPPTPAAASSGR